jgi:solute carrier family 35 (UDP-galactose transporter), member B1
MFLHLTVFRKRYPLYKYAVVALVTAGVAVFTLHHPSSSSKKRINSGNSAYGLFLLSINLLFDGLTNSTQDHIFSNFQPYTGPQMMVALNTVSTILTSTYLLATPYIPTSIMSTFISNPNELSSAVAFLRAHPAVLNDVLAFAACGAIGQIFIFLTLSRFSSLLLVTVTVTRKMLSMLVSVLMFGHRLTGMQWLGVGLVFGGIGGEAWVTKREKEQKKKAKTT